MSASQRPADRRSPLVFDTRTLGRRAGAMTTVTTTVPAPAGLGIEVISVPEGSPIELDLRLESVVEGVLVTGTATMEAVGECVRCLREVTQPIEVDVQELFTYPGVAVSDEETSRLEGELIDLEAWGWGDEHRAQPLAVSITNTTEADIDAFVAAITRELSA